MKKIGLILLFFLIIILLIFISSGYQKRIDVILTDYSLSEDGTKIKLKVSIASSMGYIRSFKVKQGGDNKYITFYSTFGFLNSKFGAKNEFEIELNSSCNQIYFYKGDKAYNLVLQKNPYMNNEWIPVNEMEIVKLDKDKVYDYNNKISIVCPDGWKIVLPNGGEGENRIATLNSRINNYAGIVCGSYQNFDNETLQEHLDRLAEGYDEYYETKIAESDAIVCQNKSQIQYGECVARAFFMKDGWTYEITFYANSEELYEQYYNTFEEVLKTVEIY